MKTKTYGLQNETRQYLRRLYSYGRELVGTDIVDIDDFVKGLKQLNLWNNTICWPMRSIHNIGTGSVVLSLGGAGRYDGAMINSPTWNTNWIDTSPTNSYITIQYPFANATTDRGTIVSCFSNFASNYGIVYSLRGASGSIQVCGTRNNTTQIYASRYGNNAIVTKAGLNTNNTQFASFRFFPTTCTTRWNGTNAIQAGIGPYVQSSATQFQIGRELTTQYAVRCSLMFLLRDFVISDTQHDMVESLIKTTIGRGLLLP